MDYREAEEHISHASEGLEQVKRDFQEHFVSGGTRVEGVEHFHQEGAFTTVPHHLQAFLCVSICANI